MILQSTIDSLDKNKVYCKYCINDNKISELIWNEKSQKFTSCHLHCKNTHSYIVKFYNKSWYLFRGKGLATYYMNAIETDKDIQNAYLNCRFIYFDVTTLHESIKIIKSKSGQFGVSIFLDGITYIHANSKDPFISYNIDLQSNCDYCGCEYKFKELSYSLAKPGLHFCCNNHSLQCRNRSDKMRMISTKRMTEWHQTIEGKVFTIAHYKKLGNSETAHENLKLGRIKCQELWIGSKNHKDHLSKLIKNNQKPGLCVKCKTYTNHRNVTGIGIECGCDVKYCKPKLNFITKENVRYYKGIEINELINKLNTQELPTPSGFNKRLGEWCYGSKNILTDEIINLNSNFVDYQDVKFYFDKSIGEYVPWVDFKERFKSKQNIELINGFELFTTFRHQNSEDWSGAKSAFEQNLVDSNIGWFVYIKYDELNRPLVVGNSGSLLVNSNGSDLSFSTSEDHGPARRFLIEEGLDWCKTQIAILLCNSKKEAYQIESELQINHTLFGS